MSKVAIFIRLIAVMALALITLGTPRHVAGAPNEGPIAALDPNIQTRVLPAAVQVGILVDVTKEGSTRRVSLGMGSGTMIDPRGYILTNFHVADMSNMREELKQYPNVTLVENRYSIMITDKPEAPPQPLFMAELAAQSPEYDLAVLRVKEDINGSPVNPDSLNLPFIELGDSDAIGFGAQLHIFGYPAIGGDTITYVEGQVSGFTGQGDFPKAWIKTNAAISGGNSGGTGLDSEGKLVGVPTQGGSGQEGAQQLDCRPQEDTNNDGQVGEGDTCVPIGGFINALRSVNVAKPLIQQALVGAGPGPSPGPVGPGPGPNPQSTPSPDQTPSAQPTAAANTGGTLGPINFTGDGQPAGANNAFATGVREVTANFQYSGFQPGGAYHITWLANGQPVIDTDETVEQASGTEAQSIFRTDNVPLPDGTYEVRLSVGGQPQQAATATVGGGTPPQQPSADGVRITGTLVDAVSGQPIPGATFVVLQKGITWDTFQNTEGEILEQVTTDQSGVFQTTVPLERGTTYSVGAVASGYQPTVGTLDISAEDPAVVNLNPIGLTAEGQ